MAEHQKIHKPSLGPYSIDNPKRCLDCGRFLYSDIPLDAPCPVSVADRERAAIVRLMDTLGSTPTELEYLLGELGLK